MKILVPGGTGYIGSHTCVELLNNNYEIVVVDNLSNSKIEVVDKIKKITGKDFKFYEGDVCDKELMNKIFDENDIDSVIHFAGYKVLEESIQKPLMYYRNNIDSTLTLLETMKEYNCKKIVFSSSAAIYKNTATLPIKEDADLHTVNPYGRTKLMIEEILEDLYKSDIEWNIVLLRYFNPIGAHESGLLGDDPNGIPNNLMPYIVKVANKELPYLNIFGNDYDTHDGTGVRDYIHVVDLSIGHIKAIEKMNENSGINAYNLGTGVGYSVLDIVNTFKEINNVDIPYQITARRAGDNAKSYSNPTKAKNELNWIAKKDLKDMCKDSWNYIMKNRS